MKTIQKIIELNGGLDALTDRHINVENEPYMRLVIERIENGPRNLPQISVCHYGEQNGDAMRDPEMCFEIDRQGNYLPVYYRNDYANIEQFSVERDYDNGQVYVKPKLIQHLRGFARTWNKNLREQGFIEAFNDMKG